MRPALERPRGPKTPPGGWQIDPSGLWLPPHWEEPIVECSSVSNALAGRQARFNPVNLLPSVWYEREQTAYTDTAGTTLVTSTSDFLALWKNRGSLGSSADASQPTLSLRPAISKVFPLVPTWDNSDDYLAMASNISTVGAATIWMRFRMLSTADSHTGVFFQGPSASDVVWLYQSFYAPNGLLFLLGSTGTQNGVNVNVVLDTAWHTVVVVRTPGGTPNASDPTEYLVRIDGVTQTVTTGGATGGTWQSRIGNHSANSKVMHGPIVSVGRCPRAITMTEITQLEGYLSTLS